MAYVQQIAYRLAGIGFDCSGGYEWVCNLGDSLPDGGVTHWQPIPAAPSEAKAEPHLGELRGDLEEK